ncbi:MAG: alpha/beta hydrolase [Planctomycetaceae bacterium]|nr:alpha/beta hydrolase [Planctomycetaceae bacterium]
MATVPSIFRLLLAVPVLLSSPAILMGQLSGPTLLPPAVSNPSTSTEESLPQYQNLPAASSPQAGSESDPEIVVTPRIQIPTYRTSPQPTSSSGTNPLPQIHSRPSITNRTLKPVVPPTYKQPELTTPQIQADPVPPQHTSPDTSTARTEHPVGGTWREADYWIVNSSRLPQSRSDEWKLNGQPAELDYIHFDQDRTFRRYPREKYQNWFEPGTPVCVIVHGSFTSWESLRYESGHLYHWLKRSAKDQPLQVVFYSWPSASQLTGLLVSDVEILGERSTYNARYLQQAILDLPETSPVTLFGHSHGARMCAQTLHDLGYSQNWKSRQDQADIQAIFVAAAFDHHWLQPGQRNDQLIHVADRILNMKNSSDLALAFYSLQGSTGAEPLGRVGFTPQDRQWIGSNMTKVKELDMSPFIGTAHLWASFYQRGDLGKYVSDFVLLPAQDKQKLDQQNPSPVAPSKPNPDLATTPSIPQYKINEGSTFKPITIQPHQINDARRSRMQPFSAGLPLIRGRRPISPPTASPNFPRKW